ncbi:hypothetical protein RHSIM_Rhsim13G0212100 [Rhododendron simsii]|uniref:PGG domain-containing protein n=1 Tax=Rhododendron simsii TaxID=118357 RepID=A0A834G2J5_RHOSS|nr:hypothetical protein RHSIM_Rhsim13G0212100 [Rhododendron simsii]
MHLQTLELVKCFCKGIASLPDSAKHRSLTQDAILLAAKNGIPEIIHEIVESFPSVLATTDAEGRGVLMNTVLERKENAFNLVYQLGKYSRELLLHPFDKGNHILHLAGKLPPENKLSQISGAALQMQLELQWFEAVKKLMSPRDIDWRNYDGKTPAMIFTEEHKKLVAEGEKWMKDTANSCTIPAVLIVTMVFAAAITVPGGINGTTGVPILYKEVVFNIFAVSDAISLFTSTTSLLVHLSILTSRFAERDFLFALPNRLIIGLLTLFVSITAMLIAFSCATYLLFGNRAWILYPVAGLACVPIISFVSLQYPLLRDLMKSTYGPGIFGKQSEGQRAQIDELAGRKSQLREAIDNRTVLLCRGKTRGSVHKSTSLLADVTSSAKEYGIASLISEPVSLPIHTNFRQRMIIGDAYQLYQAAIRGDWASGKTFFDRDKDALTPKIIEYSETVLYVAAGAGKSSKLIDFVKNLVDKMGSDNLSALDMAARNAKKDTLLYLLGFTKDVPYSKLFSDEDSAAHFLILVITSGYYEVEDKASRLLKKLLAHGYFIRTAGRECGRRFRTSYVTIVHFNALRMHDSMRSRLNSKTVREGFAGEDESVTVALGFRVFPGAGGTGPCGAGEEEEYSRNLPLYKAALRGDWVTAERFFDQDPGALTAPINEFSETALSVAAVHGRNTNDFVKKLVDKMPPGSVDEAYGSVLNRAASVGNTEGVKVILSKNPSLVYYREDDTSPKKKTPFTRAATNGKRDTLLYLLELVKNDEDSSKLFPDEDSAVFLMVETIRSGFYDIALYLFKKYPAFTMPISSAMGLEILATTAASAFKSGTHYQWWQRIIYAHVPVKSVDSIISPTLQTILVENPADNRDQVMGWSSYNWAARLLVEYFCISVPCIKHIQKQKEIHLQSLELVKCFCKGIASLPYSAKHSSVLTKEAILSAARNGIPEIVHEIVESFPAALWTEDEKGRRVFDIAVLERQENAFNLIYQMGKYSRELVLHQNDRGKHILHLAGKLAPPTKLNQISGAALQMQFELQWFEAVKKLMSPRYIDWKNNYGKTPAMIFTEEHKELVAKGEKWMKDTANSCTIPAALVVAMVFAAAITIPGGINGTNGVPIFSKEVVFNFFAVSDAISLFTSTTSLLVFLSILTPRYAQGDFLFALPNRLIIGLFTLFVSIMAMLIAFSSAIYLLFGNRAWILYPVAWLVCVPIISFASLHYPLLRDIMKSTYGPGIFGKQSESKDVSHQLPVASSLLARGSYNVAGSKVYP